VWWYQKHGHHYAIPRISVLPEKEVKKFKIFYSTLKSSSLLKDTNPEAIYRNRK